MTDDRAQWEFLHGELPVEPARRPRGDRFAGFSPWTTAPLGVIACLVVLGATDVRLTATEILAVLTLAGGLGAGAGLVVADRRRRRFAAARAAAPGEPWLWDHEWDPAGTAGLVHAAWWPKVAASVGPVFGAVVGVMLLTRPAPPVVLVLVFGFFAALWAAGVWHSHAKGTVRVSFARFPFHPGEPVVLYVGVSEGGATFERAAFHLRRVHERAFGLAGWFRGTFTTFERTSRRPPGLLPGPDQDVERAFDLPADVRGTSLSTRQPEYWVLDIVARTLAGPFTDTFLVPIYDRPT
jgi:hypothetical protein